MKGKLITRKQMAPPIHSGPHGDVEGHLFAPPGHQRRRAGRGLKHASMCVCVYFCWLTCKQKAHL